MTQCAKRVYQTQYTDPTSGDVLMQARWYSPASGTFRSRDTYAGTLNTPVTLNRYTYANNNPIRYDDPTGRCANYVFDTCVDRVAITGDSSGFDDLGTRRIAPALTSSDVGFSIPAEARLCSSTSVDPASEEAEYVLVYDLAGSPGSATVSRSAVKFSGWDDRYRVPLDEWQATVLDVHGAQTGASNPFRNRYVDYQPLSSGLGLITVDGVDELGPVIDRWSSHFQVPSESVSLVLEWEGRHFFEGRSLPFNKPVFEEILCVQAIHACEGALGTKSLGIGSIQTTLGASLYESVLGLSAPRLSQLAAELHTDYELNVIFAAAHIADNRSHIDPRHQGVFTDFMGYAYDPGAIKINNAAGWTVPGLRRLGLTPGNFSDRLSAYNGLVSAGP